MPPEKLTKAEAEELRLQQEQEHQERLAAEETEKKEQAAQQKMREFQTGEVMWFVFPSPESDLISTHSAFEIKSFL
jgi:hypothetical protein